jgi:hypothetical protein
MSSAYDNIKPNYGRIDPKAGQDLLATTTQENRDFYRDNALDESLNLRAIGLGMGAGNQFTAAADGLARSNANSDTVAGQYSRDSLRTGVAGDGTQQASRSRRLGLRRVLSSVDSANGSSRNARAQQRAAAAYGTQLYGDLTTDANGALTSIARSEVERENQLKGAKAGATGSAAGLVGMVASFI